MNDDEIKIIALFFSLAGIAFGIALFRAGLKPLRVRRIIQDTPTSKIATAAVGANVEIKGQPVFKKLVTSPLSGKPCVFFCLLIEKLVEENKWQQVDRIYSHPCFFLEDGGNALAAIEPMGASLDLTDREKEETYSLNNLPRPLRQALEGGRDQLQNLWLPKKSQARSTTLFSRGPEDHRFSEWTIQPKDNLYILGYAHSGLDPDAVSATLPVPFLKQSNIQVLKRAKKRLWRDQNLQARLDQNQDGVLDQDEFMAGIRALVKNFKIRMRHDRPPVPIVLRKGDTGKFIISNKTSEKELVVNLGIQSFAKVFGGAALAIGGAVMIHLLMQAK